MSLNVVLFGPPGAGKGTQAARLAAAHGIPKISTGDMLREATRAGTDVGRAVKGVMASGHLVSDALIIEIVRERLAQPDAREGFVLDGFPRTVSQAEALDRIAADRGPLLVLLIEVPEEVLVQRLSSRLVCATCGTTAPPQNPPPAACAKCGGAFAVRQDDGEQVVRERLKVYVRQTRPLVELYRGRPTFFRVDGNQPPDAVHAALNAILEPVPTVGTHGNAGEERAS